MNDEAVLAQLKQQLDNFIENHRQIIKDLGKIFDKIDEDGKSIVRIESELKSNADKDKMIKEALNKRIDETDKEVEDISKKFDELKKNIESENKARQDFEVEIKASLRATKWIAGGLTLICTILVAIFAILQYVKS